ncbi:MAG: AarF/ABC1/UbiB kinase family protein [Thermodesulfovibrionales bacterium]|nr:AarF/ABC1/UbiB kinase family protein [Thermodesulfovibrionales bacterium]
MPLSFLRLRRRYKDIVRLRQILSVFFKYGFYQFIEQVNLARYIPFRKRILEKFPYIDRAFPERLRHAFEELGPSFIKLAQILSARPDLITKAYADEFKKLQDEVPPFRFEEVRTIIQEELGAPLEEIFKDFEVRPIAAASIAQVHGATLKSGESVVVKIQRPRIKEIIETDIDIMKFIAELMDRYMPEAEFFNPKGIVEEFSKTVRKELNFREEAKNLNRFRRNFEGHKYIYIPRFYPEYLTEKVMVMERIHGIRIDRISEIEKMGFDRTHIAKIGLEAYLKMIFEDGYFHADPHPGNIFIMPDGRIGLVDFGIVGYLTPELMENLAQAFISLVRQDFDSLIEQYIDLGFVSEEVDIESFRREFKADLMDFLVPLYGASISEINFAEYLDTLTHLGIKHKLRIPSDFLLVNKSMLILDSIARELDPSFNFISVAEPYASKLIRSRYSPGRLYERVRRNIDEFTAFATSTPRQLRLLLRKTLKDELQVKITHLGLERLIRDIDRSANRLSFSIIVAAIILGSSILTLSNVGGKVFDMPLFGAVGFFMAFVLGVWLLISIIRSGRL